MGSVFQRSMLTTVLLAIAQLCVAHHSASMFDTDSRVVVEGVVTKYEWKNPHVYLYVESESDTGQLTVWEVEAHPPVLLKRMGWSRDSFSVGERVVVTGQAHRNPGRFTIRVTDVRRSDGTRLVSSSSESALDDGVAAQRTRKGLSGTWLTIRDRDASSRLTYSGSATLPLTPKGFAAIEAFSPELDPGKDCIPYTAPIAMLFPDAKSIEIDEKEILIRTDFEGVERIVYMDVESHGDAPTSRHGHSIGRWEGEVLVVDTQRFSDHATGNTYSLPSGQQKHLVERFKLNTDGMSLTYHYELEDPEYLAAPITGEARWDHRPDLELSPEECDLENARRFLLE